ncbi:MAG TPA: TldD/PmbA family protein [Thermoproteales archaeon]|nr:TldD/PmbA family protein [Thermoproteales archaeon]
MEWVKDLLHELTEEGLKLGACYVEARYEKTYVTSLVASNERVERISVGIEEGIGVRVLANGAFSFFTSDVIDRELLLKQLKEAVSSAKIIGERRKEKTKLAEVKPVKDTVVEKARKPPQDVELEEKISYILGINRDIRSRDKRIVNALTRLFDSYDHRVLVTSEGTEISYTIPRIYLSTSAVAFEAGRQSWYGKGEASPEGYEFLDRLNLEKLIKLVVEKSLNLLKAEPAPAGRFTVVIDGELSGVFIHEAFGHACEGDGIVAGTSILKGRLGERVGSELVTVYDDSTLPKGWGSLKYDDEGVPTTKRTLVEKGILVGYITNRESAAKLNLTPNGGARAQSYRYPPIVRMSNTYIAPGDWSFEEMIEDIKHGVYLKGSRGGQVDPSKGTFQFNAKEAYLIENGEVTKPLLDVSLSGFTLDILANVDAIGKDFELRPGFCGKGGQAVPAGTGGPHVRVKEAIVGGRR